MKVALAHDFLIRWGGAESVLFDLHKIFPSAPIFTLFYNENFVQKHFPGTRIESSYLQRKYVGRRGEGSHRKLAPSMPLAVESLDFSDYDLVISTSSGFMKGIVVPSKTKHICYLHTPTRWAWQDYHLNKLNIFKRIYTHFFRLWDFEASQRPDVLVANSDYTLKRIERYYRRKAKLIYPAVTIPKKESKVGGLNYKQYFIIISRLSPFKHIDWAIEAFRDLPYNLVVIGEGPAEKDLKRQVKKNNLEQKITFLNFLEDKQELINLIKGSLGLIHLAEEDFGLAIVEALKLNKLVVAYNRGGAKELIEEGASGAFFGGNSRTETIQNLIDAIERGVEMKKKRLKNIPDFSYERFSGEIRALALLN